MEKLWGFLSMLIGLFILSCAGPAFAFAFNMYFVGILLIPMWVIICMIVSIVISAYILVVAVSEGYSINIIELLSYPLVFFCLIPFCLGFIIIASEDGILMLNDGSLSGDLFNVFKTAASYMPLPGAISLIFNSASASYKED